jgi:hypothetical protein
LKRARGLVARQGGAGQAAQCLDRSEYFVGFSARRGPDRRFGQGTAGR